MPAELIPQAFWFRMALTCRRLDAIPRVSGRLLDLPTAFALPDFAELSGTPAIAEVRAAWNPRGIGLAFAVRGKRKPVQSDPYTLGGRDEVEFWIDTRDTREAHRATRFCHRFLATFPPSGKRDRPSAEVRPLKIARATEDPPTRSPAPDAIRTWFEPAKGGYDFECFLTASALHGYDPETNRRLGFTYRVLDPERGEQFLTLGREFPIGEDPSLWPTFVLDDGGSAAEPAAARRRPAARAGRRSSRT